MIIVESVFNSSSSSSSASSPLFQPCCLSVCLRLMTLVSEPASQREEKLIFCIASRNSAFLLTFRFHLLPIDAAAAAAENRKKGRPLRNVELREQQPVRPHTGASGGGLGKQLTRAAARSHAWKTHGSFALHAAFFPLRPTGAQESLDK